MPAPWLASLWLLAIGSAPSELAPTEVDAVEVPWARVQEMRAALEDDASATAPGPWVKEREIELRAVEGGLLLEGRWTIVAPRAGFVAQPLLGPGIELHRATLGGAMAPAIALPGGTTLVAWIDRDVELEVRAFVPGSGLDRIELALMPATRGRMRVEVPGRVPVPVVDEATGEAPPLLQGGVVWSGASTLVVELRDPSAAPPTHETLAVAHAGVGLTVGDGEVRGRARVQWELRHGALTRVRTTVEGVGDDLTVEGRDVARWTRTGDAIDVELTAPVATRVDLELRWTQALGAGDQAQLPLPRIEPEAWRAESSLQLARDGELEVIPEVAEGTAIAAADLPPWGQGLVEGTPTAAYERAGGPTQGHLELLRFVPVPGPPTVVDVATVTVATTEEGRVLMKAHYDLRNDRAAHLTVRPPPGLRIIGARVGSETALPSRDDDDAWRIPLRRSLETVNGLLSFPVEVILLGEQEPWQRRERRELPLPTLDAPVAATRVTVFLPPGYRSRLEPGEHDVVDAFGEGEGLTYGRGVGMEDTAVADALFEQAVQGYLGNDFEQAQAKLEQLQELGVSNENMARLQANIDVIEGKTEAKDKGDLTLQRRVKEQAKARAAEDFRRQETLIAEAEKAAEAGDYTQAEAQYWAALDLGGKLAKLEQAESVEQDSRNASVEQQLQSMSKKSKKRADAREQRERERLLAVEKAAQPREAIRLGGDDGPLDGVDGGAGAGGQAEAPAATGAGELVTTPTSVLDPSQSEPEPELDEPAPPPEPEPDVLASRDRLDEEEEAVILAEEAPPMRARFSRGRDRRARNTLDTKYKSRGPVVRRRSRGLAAGSKAPSSSGVTVYDFEDDDLDGEILRPEGANLSSRARGKAASPMAEPPASITVDELAPADDPAPARDDASARPLDALPAPEVTASALSVVIPATGQAVRYEQLLIDANHTHTIEIHARRRLRR